MSPLRSRIDHRTLRFGTRGSRLARGQTLLVRLALMRNQPSLSTRDVVLETRGDRDLATPLPEIGRPGVFTEALERSLLAGDIDVAVHSLKDLPVQETEGLVLAAIGFRDDARDVVVSRWNVTLATLPAAAGVGTCSHRRTAQLLALRSDLRVLPLRGNVDTRVRKVLAGEFDAIILAAAGVRRLGLESHVTEVLPFEVMLPAPGQGALAVQCRADDEELGRYLAALDEPAIRSATDAERGFLEGLGGGCTAPIAAWGRVEEDGLVLDGLVAAPDGSRLIRLRTRGPASSGREAGLDLARRALEQGAGDLLR